MKIRIRTNKDGSLQVTSPKYVRDLQYLGQLGLYDLWGENSDAEKALGFEVGCLSWLYDPKETPMDIEATDVARFIRTETGTWERTA